jgi:hypothetical protein
MKCLKLSTRTGWKPHILCDLLEINKYALDKWMKIIEPGRSHNVFSTFEIIMICTIINFNRKTKTDIEELLKVNWIKFKSEIINKIKNDDRMKKIQINWELMEIQFTDYENYIDAEIEGMSSSFDLDEIIQEVIRCFIWKNHVKN